MCWKASALLDTTANWPTLSGPRHTVFVHQPWYSSNRGYGSACSAPSHLPMTSAANWSRPAFPRQFPTPQSGIIDTWMFLDVYVQFYLPCFFLCCGIVGPFWDHTRLSHCITWLHTAAQHFMPLRLLICDQPAPVLHPRDPSLIRRSLLKLVMALQSLFMAIFSSID